MYGNVPCWFIRARDRAIVLFFYLPRFPRAPRLRVLCIAADKKPNKSRGKPDDLFCPECHVISGHLSGDAVDGRLTGLGAFVLTIGPQRELLLVPGEGKDGM